MNCEICREREAGYFDKEFEAALCGDCRDELGTTLTGHRPLKAIFGRRWTGFKNDGSCDICNDRAVQVRSRLLEIDTCLTCAERVRKRSGQSAVFEAVTVHEKRENRRDGHDGKRRQSAERSPYDVLRVSEGATPEEITAAYRRMAQMYHPDKVAALGPEFGEIAERRMKEINAAYHLLKRP